MANSDHLHKIPILAIAGSCISHRSNFNWKPAVSVFIVYFSLSLAAASIDLALPDMLPKGQLVRGLAKWKTKENLSLQVPIGSRA